MGALMDWIEAHAVIAALSAVFAGVAIVTLAKLYGFIFMRGQTVHRLGTAMEGQTGTVSEWSTSATGGHGLVFIGGELWQATARRSFAPGDRVVVKSVNGLRLDVDVA